MLSVLSAAKALYIRLQQMGQTTNLDAGTYIFIQYIYIYTVHIDIIFHAASSNSVK